jgi:hypothetical protein
MESTSSITPAKVSVSLATIAASATIRSIYEVLVDFIIVILDELVLSPATSSLCAN